MLTTRQLQAVSVGVCSCVWLVCMVAGVLKASKTVAKSAECVSAPKKKSVNGNELRLVSHSDLRRLKFKQKSKKRNIFLDIISCGNHM